MLLKFATVSSSRTYDLWYVTKGGYGPAILVIESLVHKFEFDHSGSFIQLLMLYVLHTISSHRHSMQSIPQSDKWYQEDGNYDDLCNVGLNTKTGEVSKLCVWNQATVS